MIKPEILSPAGSAESVIAAVNGGCDAIYIGGNAFNARRYADSPSDDALKEIIRQCHLRGVKVHITLNTLYKENELNDVLDFASKMYSYGADAYIIQDLGFFSLVKKNFPLIAPHASTQLTTHNLSQARTLKDMGFERVVLSRELPIDEVRSITKNVDIETEAFVHGPLCVSYSGRCLMSSMLGGRSGNRGSCAQTCRMEYRLISNGKQLTSGYLLSPKDYSTLPFLKELMDADITSWKIEGRMKSPEYVSLVTSMYRKYADNPKKPDKEDMKKLTQIFNRGGELGSGYYHCHSGKAMLSASPKSTGIYIGSVSSASGKSCTIRLTEPVNCGDGIEVWTKGEHTGTNISKKASAGESITVTLGKKAEKGDKVYKSYDKALNDSLKNTYGTYTRRSKVKAALSVKIGEPMLLRLTTADGVSVECEGPVPEAAQSRPMYYADIVAQLSKTGNTPFEPIFPDGDCGELYVPLSSLKEFKRTAFDKLADAVISHYEREGGYEPYHSVVTKKAKSTRLSVQVYNTAALETALKFSNIDIYCELSDYTASNADMLADKAHSHGSRLYISMPVIEREELSKKVAKVLPELEKSSVDGYLVRNISDIKTEKELIADYTLNTFNSASLAFLGERFNRVTLSPELNLRELKSLCGEGTEVVVYGRLPLMTTQQCPVGVHIANKHGEKYCKLRNTHPNCCLKDRKNAEFPVLTLCDSCTALILNSAPLYMGDKWDDIASLASENVRLIFTTEAPSEISDIIKRHLELLDGSDNRSKLSGVSTTAGHFYRGVL
jgi:putative protease